MNRFVSISKHLRWSLLLALLLPAGSLRGQDVSVSADLSVHPVPRWVNQPVDLVLTIRSTGTSLDRNMELSGLPPADVMHHEPFEELKVDREQHGTQVVDVRRFRARVRPLRAGTIVLQPRLRVYLLQRERAVIGTMMVRRPYDVNLQPLRLQLRDLPVTGRPDDFSGAIGTFALSVELDKTQVEPGDLITARYVLTGDGYLNELVPPRFSPGRHFRAYPPNRKPEQEDVKHLRVYEQILVPQNTNAAAIPPLEFHYFDVQRNAYHMLREGPFALTVVKDTERVPGRAATTGSLINAEHQILPFFDRTEPASAQPPDTIHYGRRTATRDLFRPLVLILALLLGGIVLNLLYRRQRKAALLAALAGLLLLAVGHRLLSRWATAMPETVSLNEHTVTRMAPSPRAAPLMEVPARQTVQIAEEIQDWVKIYDGNNWGWVPRKALQTDAE